jgi:hypothetical protein
MRHGEVEVYNATTATWVKSIWHNGVELLQM